MRYMTNRVSTMLDADPRGSQLPGGPGGSRVREQREPVAFAGSRQLEGLLRRHLPDLHHAPVCTFAAHATVSSGMSDA